MTRVSRAPPGTPATVRWASHGARGRPLPRYKSNEVYQYLGGVWTDTTANLKGNVVATNEGLQGLKGDTGATGATGLQGPRGADRRTGPQGRHRGDRPGGADRTPRARGPGLQPDPAWRVELVHLTASNSPATTSTAPKGWRL